MSHDSIIDSIKPVTLSLDDTFAAVKPLAQPLDDQTMRRIAFDERAAKTIQEMHE